MNNKIEQALRVLRDRQAQMPALRLYRDNKGRTPRPNAAIHCQHPHRM